MKSQYHQYMEGGHNAPHTPQWRQTGKPPHGGQPRNADFTPPANPQPPQYRGTQQGSHHPGYSQHREPHDELCQQQRPPQDGEHCTGSPWQGETHLGPPPRGPPHRGPPLQGPPLQGPPTRGPPPRGPPLRGPPPRGPPPRGPPPRGPPPRGPPPQGPPPHGPPPRELPPRAPPPLGPRHLRPHWPGSSQPDQPHLGPPGQEEHHPTGPFHHGQPRHLEGPPRHGSPHSDKLYTGPPKHEQPHLGPPEHGTPYPGPPVHGQPQHREPPLAPSWHTEADLGPPHLDQLHPGPPRHGKPHSSQPHTGPPQHPESNLGLLLQGPPEPIAPPLFRQPHSGPPYRDQHIPQGQYRPRLPNSHHQTIPHLDMPSTTLPQTYSTEHGPGMSRNSEGDTTSMYEHGDLRSLPSASQEVTPNSRLPQSMPSHGPPHNVLLPPPRPPVDFSENATPPAQRMHQSLPPPGSLQHMPLGGPPQAKLPPGPHEHVSVHEPPQHFPPHIKLAHGTAQCMLPQPRPPTNILEHGDNQFDGPPTAGQIQTRPPPEGSFSDALQPSLPVVPLTTREQPRTGLIPGIGSHSQASIVSSENITQKHENNRTTVDKGQQRADDLKWIKDFMHRRKEPVEKPKKSQKIIVSF